MARIRGATQQVGVRTMAGRGRNGGQQSGQDSIPKPRSPRPVDLAVITPLSQDQQSFRATRTGRVLDLALPKSLWARHGFAPRWNERRMPVARRGDELWFNADQVEPSNGPDGPPGVLVKIVQGGNMAGARRRR
jgi:hypothetical protein